jgi:hypothetical protein
VTERYWIRVLRPGGLPGAHWISGLFIDCSDPRYTQAVMTVRPATVLVVALVFAVSTRAQRAPVHPDIQGTWTGATLTPLQRPPDFKDRFAFTPAEAAEYARTAEERHRSRFPTAEDRLTQADIGDTYVETDVIVLDGLRTSLIVDPPNGMLPPLLPAAQARIAARPKRLYDGPETFGLAERCLLGNFGLGGSMASPPLMPSAVVAHTTRSCRPTVMCSSRQSGFTTHASSG